MQNFDCGVVIIGLGFGGSVAALRAAEKASETPHCGQTIALGSPKHRAAAYP